MGEIEILSTHNLCQTLADSCQKITTFWSLIISTHDAAVSNNSWNVKLSYEAPKNS